MYVYILGKEYLKMKKLFRTMCAAAVGILSCAMLAVTAYAEDYTFDVSGASESNGKWGQSFTCYTALGNEEFSENFNPMWMTSDSEVIVDYTYKGEANGSPVELIWQTWGDGPAEPNPDVTKDWNKIAPYEYTDTEAKFSFSDIAASYGSDNFDTVYAICVGDTGVNLTVTGMKVTNCNITAPVQTEEAAAEAETEAQTEEETEAETEAETEEATEAETEAETQEEDAEDEAEIEEAAVEEETEAETEETTETEATTAETTVKETTAKETSATELTRPNAAEIAANAPKGDSIAPIIIIIVVVVVVAAAAIVIIIMMIKKNKGKYY